MKILKNTLTTTLVMGALVQLLAVTPAFAEEYFTIKDGALERPTGYRDCRADGGDHHCGSGCLLDRLATV